MFAAAALGVLLPRVMQAQLGASSAPTVAGWEGSIDAGGTWNSNFLLQEGNELAGVTSRLGGRASRVWLGPRRRLALTAAGSLGRLPGTVSTNQAAYDVGISMDRQVSRRAAGRVEAAARSDIITRGLNGSEVGTPLRGIIRARTVSAATNLTYAIARQLGSQVAVSTQRVVAEGVTDFAATTGQLVTAGADVTYRSSMRSTFGVGFAYQRSSIDSLVVNLPQVVVRADHRLGARFGLQAFLGTALGGAAQSSILSRFNGGATLGFADTWGAITLSARRTVGQEFARDTPALQVGDNISLAVDRRLGRAFSLAGGASLGQTKGLGFAGREIRNAQATAQLGYTPRSGPRYTAGVFLLRLRDISTVDNYGVSAGLAFDWSQLGSGR